MKNFFVIRAKLEDLIIDEYLNEKAQLLRLFKLIKKGSNLSEKWDFSGGMFEASLARILKSFLSEFVEEDSSSSFEEKVQLGVWCGLIVLEHLVLKDKILSMLGLPLSLCHAVIGRLEIRIPWGNLGGEPFIIIVDRVNVLLEPKYEWDPEAVDNREQAVKQAKLVAAELFASKRYDAPDPLQGYRNFAKKWLMESIISKLIGNIQVTIRDVHIRYEDHVSCNSDFCFGITLESLHAQSRGDEFNIDISRSSTTTDNTRKNNKGKTFTDLNSGNNKNKFGRGSSSSSSRSSSSSVDKSSSSSDDSSSSYGNDKGDGRQYHWKDIEISGPNSFSKIIQMNHFSVYWNPITTSSTLMEVCTNSFVGRPRQEIDKLMFRTIAKRNHVGLFLDWPRHHYILLPLDLQCDLDMKFDPVSGKLTSKVHVEVPNVEIIFEDRQYREIVSLISNVSNFFELEKFSKYRPNQSIKVAPRAWWVYAINAVVYQRRKEKGASTVKALNQRIDDKKVYIELWKRRLNTNSRPVGSHSATHTGNAFETSESPDIDAKGEVNLKGLPVDAKNESWDTSGGQSSSRSAYIDSSGHAAANVRRSPLYLDILERLRKSPKAEGKDMSTTFDSSFTLNDELDLLNRMERILSFEDIVYFRSMAERDFSHEETQRGWLRGLMSWVSGGKTGDTVEEEKRKLFEALKYDPEKVFRGDLGGNDEDANVVMSSLVINLNKCSLKMALSTSPGTSVPFLPFLELSMWGLNLKANILGAGIIMLMHLDDLEASELLSQGSLGALNVGESQTRAAHLQSSTTPLHKYNKLVSRRFKTIRKTDGVGDFPSSDSTSDTVPDDGLSLPLFECFIKVPPQSTDVGITVEIDLKELVIVLSPAAQWFKSLTTFITWPADLAFWGEVEMSTLNQLPDIKRLDAKLDYILKNHTDVSIVADVKAPVIVIAETGVVQDGYDMVVMDLGHINLSTEKLAKAAHEKSRQKGGVDGSGGKGDPHRSDNDATPNRRHDFSSRGPVASGVNVNESLHTVDATTGVDSTIENNPHQYPPNSTTADETIRERVANFSNYRGFMQGSHAESTINTQVMDFDTAQDRLFDVFQVTIKDVEVFMTASTVSIFSQQRSSDRRDHEASKTVGIVDRFDITLEVQVSVLPYDRTIPLVKLCMEFPEINVRISDLKLQRLALFSRKLVRSSNDLIEMHRDKVKKMLSANAKKPVSQIYSINSFKSDSSRSCNSLDLNFHQLGNLQPSARVPNRETENNDDTDDYCFYDAESFDKAQSLSDNNNNRASTNNVQEPLVVSAGSDSPPSKSNASLNLSQSRLGGNRRRGLSSGSLSRALGKFDTKSRTSTFSFRSSEKGFEDVVGKMGGKGSDSDSDSDNDSDDSFDTAEEDHSLHGPALVNELLFAIKQRENVQSELMSEMRIIEAGTDETSLALYKTLQDELALCESELHQLKIQYLESRMNEASFPITDDTGERGYREKTMAFHDFFDDLLKPVAGQDDLDHKRKILKSTIFKSQPQQRFNGRELKKEIAYGHVKFGVINIILSFHDSPSPSSATLVEGGTSRDLLRFRLAGVSMKAKHRNRDSKITLVMGELDVEDVIASNATINEDSGRSTPIFFISSEPSASGVMMPHDRNMASDLLRLRYDIYYAFEAVDAATGNRRKVDERHQLRVSCGFLGLNLNQSTLVNLVKVAEVANDLPKEVLPTNQNCSPKSKRSKKRTVSPMVEQASISMSYPREIVLSFKSKGMSVALLHNNRPFVTASAWRMQLLFQVNQRGGIMNCSLLDVAIHHFSETAQTTAIRDFVPGMKRRDVLRRKSDTQPLVVYNMKLDFTEKGTIVETVIKTAPLRVILVPSFIDSICNLAFDGDFSRYLSHRHQKPLDPQHQTPHISFSMNGILESFIKFCSGKCDVLIGDFEISFPTSYDGPFQALSTSCKIDKAVYKSQWGDFCPFHGIEALLTVSGINAKVASIQVIEDFEISTVFYANPIKEESTWGVNSDSNRTNVLPLSGEGLFQPEYYTSVPVNTFHASTTISPLIVHISEILLHEMGNWLRENGRYFHMHESSTEKSFSERLEGVPERREDVALPFENPLSSLGLNLSYDILFFEVALSLDACDKTSNSRNGTPGSKPKQYMAHTELLVPVLYLSLRRLQFNFAVEGYDFQHDLSLDEDDSFTLDDEFSTLQNETVRTIVSASLKSFDVVYMHGATDEMKRLVCTSALDNPLSQGSKSLNNLFTESERIDSRIDSSNCAMTMVIEVSQFWDVVVQMEMYRLQIFVIAPAIVKLAKLVELYLDAFNSSLVQTRTFNGSRLSDPDLKGKSKKQQKGTSLSSSPPSTTSSKESWHAHPASIPLAVSSNPTPQSSNLQSSGTKSPIVLRRESFALPSPLQSLKVMAIAKSCGLWVPSDYHKSNEVALCFAVDCESVTSFHLIDWDQCEQSHGENPSQEDVSNLCFWSTKLCFSSARVFLSPMVHVESFDILRPMVEILDLERKLEYLESPSREDSNWSSTDPMSQHVKVIVLPFSGELSHSSTIEVKHMQSTTPSSSFVASRSDNSSTKSYEIFNKVDIRIQEMEIIFYLDYRPFLKLWSHSLLPIKDLALILLQDNSTDGGDISNISAASRKTVANQSGDHLTTRVDSYIVIPTVFDLIISAADKSRSSLSLTHDGKLCVLIVNDLNHHPVTLARAICSFTRGDLIIRQPPMNYENSKTFDLPTREDKRSPSKKTEGSLSGASTLLSSSRALLGQTFLAATQTMSRSSTATYFDSSSSSQQFQAKPPVFSASDDTLLDSLSSNHIELNIQTTFCIEYHNQNLMCWDPLLEPFSSKLNFSKPFSQFDVPTYWFMDPHMNFDLFCSSLQNKVKEKNLIVEPHLSSIPTVNTLRSQSSPHPVSGHHGEATLSVLIDDTVNVNVTVPFLESMGATISSILSLNSSKEVMGPVTTKKIGKDTNDLSTMIIRNDSGLLIRYWCTDVNRTIDLPPNVERPFTVDVANASRDMREKLFDPLKISRMVSLKLWGQGEDSWSAINNIPLDVLGSKIIVSEYSGGNSTEIVRASVGRQLKKRASRILRTPPTQQMLESNNICVVAEVVSRGGIRTLIVRSTLSLVNANTIALHVKIATPLPSRKVFWEAIIPPGSEISVPANFCHLPSSMLLILPLADNSNVERINVPAHTLSHAEVPVPEIPALSSGPNITQRDIQYLPSQHSIQGDDHLEENIGLDDNFLSNAENNLIKWRFKKQLDHGNLTVQSFSHWLTFQSQHTDAVNEERKRAHCNAKVVAYGVPRSLSTDSSGKAGTMMNRTITFSPPIIVSNLLACGVEVILFAEGKHGLASGPKSTRVSQQQNRVRTNIESVPDDATSVLLQAGESFGCSSFHALEDFSMSLRLLVSGSPSSRDAVWSNVVMIQGSRADQQQSIQRKTTCIDFANESELHIMLEIEEKDGMRSIKIYVPYWVITSSFLTVQYQHDTSAVSSSSDRSINNSKGLNGVDGLAADQPFEDKNSARVKGYSNNRGPPRGIGKARGIGGVILGPELPIRGLADVLGPRRANEFGGLLTRKLDDSSSIPIFPSGITNMRSILSDSMGNEAGFDASPSSSDLRSKYRLMQCGYTNEDQQTGRLRLRGNGTHWSNFFPLDSTGSSIAVEVKSVRGYVEPDGLSWAVGRPPVRGGNQIFTFGIFTMSAEPPFQRTKIVVVVDRFVFVNSMGQSLEARQAGMEDMTTIHANDETPFWWRPGEQYVQVRLARYGWGWSGKFSIKQEGETPLRLRNEHDNTVFFVLVHVIKQGPRVCVIFKGGDRVAPYRIENHTLETFKLYQAATLKSSWSGNQSGGVNVNEAFRQSTQTSLLPYHSCAYAWDEPLAPQEITIDLLKSGQSRGESIGTFSFNRLQTFPQVGHLIIRLVAQGPVRVLQIHDDRNNESLSSYPFHSNSQMKDTPSKVSQSMLQISLTMSSLGISIVDHLPQELIYLSVSKISFQHSLSAGQDSFHLNIGKVQLDSQLFNTPFPSMLYPLSKRTLTAIESNNAVEKENIKGAIVTSSSPFLSFILKRDFSYPGVSFIPLVSLKILPYDVNIEGHIIRRLFDMWQHLSSNSSQYELTSKITTVQTLQPLAGSGGSATNFNSPVRGKIRSESGQLISSGSRRDKEPVTAFEVTLDDGRPNTPPSTKTKGISYIGAGSIDGNDFQSIVHSQVCKVLKLSAPPRKFAQGSAKVYLQNMELSELRLNFSFITEGLHPQLFSKLLGPASGPVLMTVLNLLHKIDSCPLRFKGYNLEHSFSSVPELMSALKFKYGMQAATQVHLIIGSTSMLSSVLQLLYTLIEGMWDCIHLPLVGLMTSPEEFTNGVGRGLSSLLRSTAVIFSTSGNFFSSLQACMIKLGFIDSDFHVQNTNLAYNRNFNDSTNPMIRHQQHLNRPPKGGIDGVRQGIHDLFVDPIIGFQKGGISGLFLGFAKGCFRLIAKPLYGMLGNASSTMETISFLLLPRIKGDEKLRLKRARPPRYFRSANMPLQIYSADENIGQELLSRVEMGFYHSEGYVWHTRLYDGTILILTSIRLLLVGEKTYDFCELLWQCLSSQILFLEIEYDRHLLLTSPQPPLEVLSKDSIIISSPTTTTSTPSDKNKQFRFETTFCCNDSQSNIDSRIKNLKGLPILNVYHLPCEVSTSSSPSLWSKQTPGGSRGSNPGLQVTHRSLNMASHEQLIDLMSRLLRPHNISLVDKNVSTYLGDCGIHVRSHGLFAPNNRSLSPIANISQQSSMEDMSMLQASNIPSKSHLREKRDREEKYFVSPSHQKLR